MSTGSIGTSSRLVQVEDDQLRDEDRRRVANQQFQQSTRLSQTTSSVANPIAQVSDKAAGQTNAVPGSEHAHTSTIGANAAAPLDRTASIDDVAAHQQVIGSSETRLAPASAPAVTLSANGHRSAESFAANLDQVINSIVNNAKPATRNSTEVGPATAITITSNRVAGQLAGKIDGMSADQLLSAFLKLNVNDPNESVETHDRLYTAASNLRQQALEDAKKQTDNAEQKMKDAQSYADQAQMIGTVVEVVSIALTICTFGAGAVVGVAAMSATEGATAGAEAAAHTGVEVAKHTATEAFMQGMRAAANSGLVQTMSRITALASAAGQAVAATANFKAQDKMSTAKFAMLQADKSHFKADEAQERVSDEADIINKIMETKNQTVDTVMKMINQGYSTRQQLLSATMAR